MVDFGSNCVEWNNSIEEIEDNLTSGMGKIEDVEEGEISDSASVEEITEEDFNKQDAAKAAAAASPNDLNLNESKPKGAGGGGGGGGDARVWTMRDLYKYQSFRGYTTGLYNLAWAQAVQNKPLNEIFVMDVDADQDSKLSSSSPAAVVDKVVIDDSGDEMDTAEKEEGELEEGEIDLESEPSEKAVAAAQESKDDATNVGDIEIDSVNKELEKRVFSIREDLERANGINNEKSFEQVCARLHNNLESLQGVVSKYSFPAKDSVIQLSFNAIRAVYSVFCSMNQNQKEQNKDILSGLLCLVKNCNPPLLPTQQLKEIELMITSVNPLDVLPSTGASDKQKVRRSVNRANEMDFDCRTDNAESANYEFTSVKLPSDVTPVVHSNLTTSLDTPRPGVSAFKGRGLLLPLLDLHKDHDADSLPSPTREAPSCSPVHKLLGVGDGLVQPGSATAKVALRTDDPRIRRYETDAVKALSTYQQKFGRSSFLMNDRLPSPTPSEEVDEGDADTNKEEVTSSFTGGSLRNPSIPILRPSSISPSTPLSSSSMQGPITAKNVASADSASNLTVKASAKSRDPRLRFANSDLAALDLNQRPVTAVQNAPKVEPVEPTSSRKQRITDESNLDGSPFKRQRNSFENARIVGDVKTVSGSGGWLEDNGFVGPQLNNKNQSVASLEADPRKLVHMVNCPTNNGPNMAKEQVPVTSMSTTASLPELLKDIAVNPTLLINLLKLGQQQQQQQLVAETQPKSDPVKDSIHPPSSNSILGAAPLVNIAPSKASGILQTPSASFPVTPQVAAMSSQDELGKIRMKPRDPRRVLHGSTLQKSGSLGNEQLKAIVSPLSSPTGNKDNLNGQMQEGQADQKTVPSQSVVPPDIGRQFTKNLRNIADIMSVSNVATSPAIVSQNVASQPVPVKPERGDVKAIVSNSEDQRNGILTPEVAVAGPSRAPNAWGDVEHLFEGYDDQQKAAIQRERTRRLEEQNKMFEARKLCLVLDLDHTLLNSAKFVEVDPLHEEILRKKEEQDREKPHRHLFRFPHMGMWTKLRPGVWNFLEKASKLYELHLYTMGNKLYATEMAKVLDPTGVLFAGRVISRGDDGDPFDGDERVPKSKDLEGVLGMESAVVIIDDSVRVWPHNKLNLIVVERYTYFPCSRRQFGLPGPSLLEIDHDERPEDGTLASSLLVIERIHQNFFNHESLEEADVRNILASEQRKILAGCRIVFSRVFPVSEVNPHLHPLWQTAEQFGAVCTTQIDDQVTHVVANSPGTDKVNWAISNGRFAVHPGWVEASALLYRRANEQDFTIKPQPPP